MQRVTIIKLLAFFTLIFSLLFLYGLFKKFDNSLKPFNITIVEHDYAEYYVAYENNKNAIKYDVIVFDNNQNTVFKETTNETNVTLNIENPSYGDEYKVKVVAYNKKEESIESNNSINFIWEEPTFSKNVETVIDEQHNYKLLIDGNFNEDYKLIIKNKNEVIIEESIKSNEYIFSQELLNYKNTKLIAQIVKNGVVLDTKNIYINVDVIEDIKIETPENLDKLSYGPIKFLYSGGEGANNIYLKIYENGVLKNTFNIFTNEQTLSSTLFKENTTYKLELIAMYEDYEELAKKNEITIKITDKQKVEPVYTPIHTSVKAGTLITLKSKTANAKIYYTLDGSKPTNKSYPYVGPFTIFKDTQIKTIAYLENMKASLISIFDFKIASLTEEIVIYLSPSNQTRNIGNKQSGYTNEKEEMNKLADLIQPKLEEKGFIVYRNQPENGIVEWTRESKKVKANLHLALHSNGSVSHERRGIETYIDYEDSKTYSLATLIQDSLVSIYDNQYSSNNKIVYAEDRLGETRTSQVPFGILLEIGYHDQYDDAVWLLNNFENVANKIVEAICKYYGY